MLKQAPVRGCGPVKRETQTRVGFLAGLLTLWTLTQEQTASEGQQPIGRTHARAGHEEQWPVERAHVGEVHGRLFHVGGTSHWSRETVWVGRHDRDKCVLNCIQPPFPIHLCCCGENVENLRVNLSSVTKKGAWGRCFNI